jgi:hypothetical protein
MRRVVTANEGSTACLVAFLAPCMLVCVGLLTSCSEPEPMRAVGDRSSCPWGAGTVLGLGDIDDDGVSDYAVGFPGCREEDVGSGRVSAYSGHGGSPLWTIRAQDRSEDFGCVLLCAGDLDSDGVGDLLIGDCLTATAPPADTTARLTAYSGSNQERLFTLRLGPGVPGPCMACMLDDINQDGAPEIALIVREPSREGSHDASLRVVSGRNGDTLFQYSEGPAASRFKGDLCTIREIENDGVVGVAVRTTDELGMAEADSNAVVVVSVRTGAELWRRSCPPTSYIFAGGDFDHDGTTDLLLPGDNETVAILSGTDGKILFRVQGDGQMSSFGIDIAATTDVDRDGTDDILVGGWSYDGGPRKVGNDFGKVWLYSGADGRSLGDYTGTHRKAHVGASVDFLPDLNGDGVPECIVGCNLSSGEQGQQGLRSGAIVLSGAELLSR